MNLIQKLASKNLIKPPPFVIGGTQYLTIMGSMAYGVSSDSSDMDVYGWCIPPKETVFPHLAGQIQGFGNQIQRFDQFQEHHILEKDTGKEYDINVYNIIKYFQLVMENNPNMIDSLFTREESVLFATKLARHVRDNRRTFLHSGSWHKFKGYAYSQMSAMKGKTEDSKRYAMVQKYGYDVKFAYHVVRLLNEVEQILMEGDLDLMRNNDQLKSIRNGEWTMEQIKEYFAAKELGLEDAYRTCKLPKYPDQEAIKKILLEVLEEHYGSLDRCVETPDKHRHLLLQIKKLTENVN